MDHPSVPSSPRRAVALRARLPADGRTRAPHPVGPSAWALPDPGDADTDGVVGIGADLAPATLVDAYRRGIFPWPHPGMPLPWFSPDPRGVITRAEFHVSRSLRRTLRRCGWVSTVDADFGSVLRACGDERRTEGTWITAAMRRAYTRLHELGWAHSLEVWDGAQLVGGIYGVQVGTVFTGESMFHRVGDASKVAMLDLLTRFEAAGGELLDVQIATDHLASLGTRELPRGRFLAQLHAGRDLAIRMSVAPAPVSRLMEHG